MKTFLQISLLFHFTFFICYFSFSQNLVENGSFENYSSCPTGQCQIHRAVGWSSFGYTPNYLNACNSGGWSVPQNAFGYQNAATGNAYASFFCYGPDFGIDQREYIGRQLLNPLAIGQKYYVSIKVTLADVASSGCAIDKLGVLFSTVSYALDTSCTLTTLLPPPNFAHIYTDSIITDTANWTTISGIFTADSAYQYIVIGNFFDDANTNYIQTDTTINCQAHYLLDDVYVALDSTTNIEKIELEEVINVYPNPAKDYINIKTRNNHVIVDIKIYDLFGTMKSQYHLKSSYNNKIQLFHLKAGIYIIEFQFLDKSLKQKLVITNPLTNLSS